MLLHDRFCLLHIPKTGGTQISQAVLQSVADVRRVDPLHGVKTCDLPGLVFVRHPLAWLVSFWGHSRRSSTDWAGMPFADELASRTRFELDTFVDAAGRAQLVSRIWSSYLLDGVKVCQCERWVTGLCSFLDDVSVPYDYDWICLSRGGTGQLKTTVSAPMLAGLRSDDPAAFELSGY